MDRPGTLRRAKSVLKISRTPKTLLKICFAIGAPMNSAFVTQPKKVRPNQLSLLKGPNLLCFSGDLGAAQNESFSGV